MLSYSPIATVTDARARGMRLRPRVGGFPYLAESLRQAGIATVHCDVISMTTVYRTPNGAVIDQQDPLRVGVAVVATFDQSALVAAIRRDQRGESTYGEFMSAICAAGVLSYEIDLDARTCTYVGVDPATATYIEVYPHVTLDD